MPRHPFIRILIYNHTFFNKMGTDQSASFSFFRAEFLGKGFIFSSFSQEYITVFVVLFASEIF